MSRSELEEQLNQVRAGFARSLRGRLSEVERAFTEDRQEALRLAHKLNGTSGSMGFEGVCRAADALERWLEREEAGSGEALLEGLRAAVAEAEAAWYNPT